MRPSIFDIRRERCPKSRRILLDAMSQWPTSRGVVPGLDEEMRIPSLARAYREDRVTPTWIVEWITNELDRRGDDGVWIHRVAKEKLLARAQELETLERGELWGVPFSVKDCIDVEGEPTSAGCPGYAYVAQQTNLAVKKVLAAGGILIGKTNMDQFATGLGGHRSGFTVPRNAGHPEYIAGGSSSGSALSVALGEVAFSLGTDTGGSGRVPASCNNIVGFKPSKGLLSCSNMVPACQSIDCVSIFALTSEDASTVFHIARGFDPTDPFSRRILPSRVVHSSNFKFGVPRPEQRAFFGNTDAEALFEAAITRLIDLGGVAVEIDYGPFLEANALLFDGPWIAERYASVGTFLEEEDANGVLPVTRKIILKATSMTAVDAFRGLYKLKTLKQKVHLLFEEEAKLDCIVTPTTGTIYRLADMIADDKTHGGTLNTNLGYYTSSTNLLDLCAIAVPNGFLPTTGLPAGVTFVAPPGSEALLTTLGSRFHHQLGVAPTP